MKLFKIVFTLLLLACGAYSAFWYTQSSKAEKLFKNHIDQLNENSPYKLKYDSIEREGFPSHFALALVNPTITEVAGSEVKINGKLIDHFNFRGELKSVEFDGKAHVFLPPREGLPLSNVLVEGKMSMKSANKSLIPVEELKNLGNVNQIMENPLKYIDLDDSVIEVSNLKIFDAQNHSLIMSFDHLNMTLDHQAKEKIRQVIALKADLKGLITSHSVQNSFYGNQLSEGIGQLYGEFIQTLSSQQGKVALGLDLDLDVPNNAELQKIKERGFTWYISHPLPELAIALNDLYQISAFGQSSLKGNLITKVEESEEESIIFNLNAEITGTQHYVDALTYAIEAVGKKAAMVDPADEIEKTLKELFVNHQKELIALIPNLLELGTLQKNIDMAVNFNRKTLHSEIDITHFDLLSELYGIQLHGEVKGSLMSTTGALTMDLLNYHPLIHDVRLYANKVIHLINTMGRQLNEISEAMEQKFLVYLREISNDPQSDAKDLQITASYLGPNSKVGTLNILEFVQKTQGIFNEIEREMISPSTDAAE